MPLTGTRFPTPQLLPVSAKDAYEGARTDAAQRSEAENAQPRPCRSPGEAEPRWAAAPVSAKGGEGQGRDGLGEEGQAGVESQED